MRFAHKKTQDIVESPFDKRNSVICQYLWQAAFAYLLLLNLLNRHQQDSKKKGKSTPPNLLSTTPSSFYVEK